MNCFLKRFVKPGDGDGNADDHGDVGAVPGGCGGVVAVILVAVASLEVQLVQPGDLGGADVLAHTLLHLCVHAAIEELVRLWEKIKAN